MFFLVVLSLAGAASAEFSYGCYPNGTIEVNHPAPIGTVSFYTNCFAVQDQGLSTAIKCTVSTTLLGSFGAFSLITGCSQDNPIVVFFSNRVGSVETFGSSDFMSFEIECSDIPMSGVVRTVSNLLGATLDVTTQDAVTPSFAISSALRYPDVFGAEIYSEYVGTQIYWTIDVPTDYSASPTCYAYSGTDASGSPSKLLVQDGCNQDPDLLGGNFEGLETPLIQRLYVNLYVFKFYNSDYVFFKCTVKVCPLGSTSCEINCSRKRRSIVPEPSNDSDKVFTTTNTIHILPVSSTSPLLGSLWLCAMTVCLAIFRY